MPVFKSLVWFDPTQNSGSAALEADALTTRTAKRREGCVQRVALAHPPVPEARQTAFLRPRTNHLRLFSQRTRLAIPHTDQFEAGSPNPEERCPARRMLVNARKWRNNASWSGVAYTTSGSKARSNARWRGRSLAFKTRWRVCFSYKSFTFICFHANFSSFSFVDRQNTYSCKSDLFAN